MVTLPSLMPTWLIQDHYFVNVNQHPAVCLVEQTPQNLSSQCLEALSDLTLLKLSLEEFEPAISVNCGETLQNYCSRERTWMEKLGS